MVAFYQGPTLEENPGEYWEGAAVVHDFPDGTKIWEGPDGKWTCVTREDCYPNDADGSSTFQTDFFWERIFDTLDRADRHT